MKIHELIDRAAEAAPEAPALRDVDGRIVSYGAHRDAIAELSDMLIARGFLPGDRLLIVAENCHAAAALIFAASRAGGVAVPVNARMTDVEIDRIVAHATPRITAWTTGVSPEAARLATRAQAQTVVTAAGEIALSDARPETGEAATADTAVLLYTTGTTGAPKGVMLTHGNLTFAGRTSAELRDIEADDIIYGALPMTHVFGLASMLMAASTNGACIQFEARFRPDRLYAALRGGATVFPGVPQMHALLMSHVAENGLEGLKDTALHYVSSGGAPLDMAWKRKAEAFYGLALQNGYGMTETTAGICATRNVIGTPDVSCGPPLPGVEIMLDTSIGDSADAGVGEVLTRGPHVMDGYYRNTEATAAVMNPDGWLRTGDMGRIDEDGFLHIVGRAKELIIRGGFNVYPPEVEAAFNDHPDVIQCAVIGRVAGGDEEVLAFVQCADPDALDLDDLRRFAAERLAAYKRPSRIVAAGTLPAAPSGKILKHKLVTAFADRLT